MARNVRLLLSLCIISITALLVLQFFWIKNYYTATRTNFGREVNLAFEDAIKKEFMLRCDTIQEILVQQLMDTSAFTISTRFSEKFKHYQIEIASAKNKKDKNSFSSVNFNKPLLPGDSVYKLEIARFHAAVLRTEDLEKHMIYYRTQDLGSFELEKVLQYGFDTVRLRPVLEHYLALRNIHTPFRFYVNAIDSTLNNVQFTGALAKQFPVITKSYPTHKWSAPKERYVRALFKDPVDYIIARMGMIFVSSLLLAALVALCIFLVLKALFREKRLSAIKNDFISNITHEFKTPIATVSAAVEALSDFNVLADEAKTKRYLQHSKNELERLTQLVNNVLNISLYENGALPLNPVSIPVEEAIHKVMEPFLLPGHKLVQYTFTNNTQIPAITADVVLFHQAISNIVDNAVKYSGEAVTINITCAVKNNYFLISMADNGNGIAANALPLVFDKFYREPANGHIVKGHGLGLNYVKGIMEAHKGIIKIESHKEKGTIVHLGWPI